MVCKCYAALHETRPVLLLQLQDWFYSYLHFSASACANALVGQVWLQQQSGTMGHTTCWFMLRGARSNGLVLEGTYDQGCMSGIQ